MRGCLLSILLKLGGICNDIQLENNISTKKRDEMFFVSVEMIP